MKKEEIINKLETIFSNKLKYQNSKLLWRNQYEIVIPDNVEDIFSHKDILDGCISIFNNNSATILLQNIDGGLINDEPITNGNIQISIDEKVPDILCARIIDLLPNKPLNVFISTMRLEHLIRDDARAINIFDLIRMSFPSYLSITIKNLNTDTFIDYLLYAKSFIFNSSMLQGRNYLIVENIQHVSHDSHPIIRRRPHEKMDIPYREYNNEVVQYYIDANSARVPKIKFLSFYNVLEYFFEKVYIDDKCLKIQELITSPKFNHNNLKHYKKILEILDIKKAKNLERVNVTEKEALKLLIKKYIDLDEFKNFLENNQFYLNNNAHKIENSKFNKEDTNEILISKICNRIYGVRNALVHSKDGEDIRYIPQKDDIHINEEIELIRYLAQEIIISTSELIK